MSGLNQQDTRIAFKYSTVSGATPTIAPSMDHTDGTWTQNDIYIGEFFLNAADDTMWIRTINGIVPITSGTSSIAISTYVNKTGDTMTGNLFLPGLSGTSITGNTIFSNNFQGTYYGDGSNLTGITATIFTGGTVSGPTIFTSIVNLLSSANYLDSIDTSGGTLSVIGNIDNTGYSISASTFYGDGSNLTGLPTLSGATLDAVLANGDTSLSGSMILNTGSITLDSGFFIGDGSLLTNIPFGATPTLDQVLTSGNTSTNGDILLTNGDISLGSGYFIGDGSLLTNIIAFDTQFSGGTVSGSTNFLNGLTSTCISATTYLGLPKDIFVTGGTYNQGTSTATFTNNTGGTFSVTGISTSSTFTGGTVTGATIFTGGLTANSFSATTYLGLPTDVRVTGGTYSNGTAVFTNNTGGTFNVGGFYTGTTLGTYLTGATYANNIITFTTNSGTTSSVLINTMTGLTVNGNLTITGNTNLQGITGTSMMLSGSGQNILTIVGSGSTNPLLVISGSTGELFSVSDSMDGSLYQINDVSGNTIVEVFSDTSITLGSYNAPSLYATTATTANSGATSIYSFPTSGYTGTFVDYTVLGSLGARAGSLMGIFSGTSVQYTETSTNDIGNTSSIEFLMTVSGGIATIKTSASTNSWTVKTIIRSI